MGKKSSKNHETLPSDLLIYYQNPFWEPNKPDSVQVQEHLRSLHRSKEPSKCVAAIFWPEVTILAHLKLDVKKSMRDFSDCLFTRPLGCCVW